MRFSHTFFELEAETLGIHQVDLPEGPERSKGSTFLFFFRDPACQVASKQHKSSFPDEWQDEQVPSTPECVRAIGSRMMIAVAWTCLESVSEDGSQKFEEFHHCSRCHRASNFKVLCLVGHNQVPVCIRSSFRAFHGPNTCHSPENQGLIRNLQACGRSQVEGSVIARSAS